MKKEYGITHEDVEVMKRLQDNKCDICGISFDVQAAHIDHDHNHNSGAVRGLLCGSCNRGIGLLKDSPEFLLKAAQYLQENLDLRKSINIT